VARVETEYLPGYIETSGCERYRNGDRYGAALAGSHLRDKYVAMGQFAMAAAFIGNVVSSSRRSGQPYEPSCAGRASASSGPSASEARAAPRCCHRLLARQRQ
jgi:hypothetical protein